MRKPYYNMEERRMIHLDTYTGSVHLLRLALKKLQMAIIYSFRPKPIPRKDLVTKQRNLLLEEAIIQSRLRRVYIELDELKTK